MENPLKNNPVGTKKCMERPGRDSMLYAWNNGKKEPVPEFAVKQSWTTHHRRSWWRRERARPCGCETFRSLGGKRRKANRSGQHAKPVSFARKFMQTDRVCMIDTERTEGKRTRSVWKVNPVGRCVPGQTRSGLSCGIPVGFYGLAILRILNPTGIA